MAQTNTVSGFVQMTAVDVELILVFQVLHFPIPHFPVLHFGPAFSGPAFSAPHLSRTVPKLLQIIGHLRFRQGVPPFNTLENDIWLQKIRKSLC